VRILILGGTRFIGRAIAETLLSSGHLVLIVHRGRTEPESLRSAAHLHASREGLPMVREELARFEPDICIDTCAMGAADAHTAVEAIPACKAIVLSSCDVYRAYASFRAGELTDPLPITETSVLRTHRLLFRSSVPGRNDYEKLDVEAVWSTHGATILRLCPVYGPRDYLVREGFILGRLLAGRSRIPFGSGNLLYTRISVGDVASCVRALVDSPREHSGEVFNISEAQTASVEYWAHQIARTAGRAVELIRVPDEELPEQLRLTRSHRQHVLISPFKAMRDLSWTPRTPEEAVRESVSWHLRSWSSPPSSFAFDDALLRRYG
jgi:nucleoside-diphosphate-sugar epimerase